MKRARHTAAARLAMAMAAVLVSVGLAVFVAARMPWQRTAVPPPMSQPAAMTLLLGAAGAAAVPAASAPAAVGAVAVAVAVTVAPAASAAPKEMLDVCGVGQVELQATPEPDFAKDPQAPQAQKLNALTDYAGDLPPHLGAHAYEAARARLVTALHAGSPRQQAVAWLLDRDPAAATQAPGAMLALARSTGDAAIWRWAMAPCTGPDNCSQARAEEWAQADADNVMPWLHLLKLAPAASQDAWRGLAQTTRFQMHHGLLTATALQAWPADAPKYLAMVLWTEMTRLENRLPWPVFHPAVQACKPPSLDATERASCDALTRVLVEGSDTLLGLAIGISLASAAGWPPDILGPLREERVRLAQVEGVPLSLQPYACKSVDRLQAHVLQLGQQGELALLRQQLAERTAAASARPRR